MKANRTELEYILRYAAPCVTLDRVSIRLGEQTFMIIKENGEYFSNDRDIAHVFQKFLGKEACR